jgi:hypothetical protein
MIRSLNLYVSQQHTTGVPAALDIIATMALPARENIAPLLNMAAAPRRVRETLERTDPMEESSTYVHGTSAASKLRRSCFPSCIGRESTTMTEKRLPCSFAANSTPSTRDDLPNVRMTSSSLILLMARSSTTLPASTMRSRMKWSILSHSNSRAYGEVLV